MIVDAEMPAPGLRHALGVMLTLALGSTTGVMTMASLGCSATGHGATAVEGTPTRCQLEAAVEELVSTGEVRVCASEATNGGVLGPREEIRRCARESVASRRLFSAVWSGNYEDGVGRRWGWVGRPEDAGYRLWLIEYTLAHGRESWLIEECESMLDLEQVCESSGGEPYESCARHLRYERHDLGCGRGHTFATCPAADALVLRPREDKERSSPR